MKLTTKILAALLFVPALAAADDANDHISKATRFYNIQDWPHALDEYKQAYTIDPKPETLWAIAQTQRLSGDCRSAVLSYKAYMRGASAAGANAANELIKSCEADIEAQRKAVEAATAAPAAEPPKPAPAPEPVRVAPPPPPAPAKPAEPRSWALDPLGDSLLVVGVGGLAVGGAYLAIGMLDARDAKNQPTSGAYDRAVSSAHTDQVIGGIATGVGAVCTGLAIWRFASVRSARAEREHMTVVPTKGGALATYTGRF